MSNITFKKVGLHVDHKKSDPVEVKAVNDLFKCACAEVEGIKTKMRIYPVEQYEKSGILSFFGLAKKEVVTEFCLEHVGRYSLGPDSFVDHTGVSMIVRHSSKKDGFEVLTLCGGPLNEVFARSGAEVNVEEGLPEKEVRDRIKSFLRTSVTRVFGCPMDFNKK